MKPILEPTNAELAILKILWQRGTSTIKEVHEALPQNKGYTTTLKFMQIMRDKNLVERVCESRPHRYRAAVLQKTTEKKILSQWIDKLSHGSAAGLAMKALDGNKVSSEEIQQLREILDQIEENNQSQNN